MIPERRIPAERTAAVSETSRSGYNGGVRSNLLRPF